MRRPPAVQSAFLTHWYPLNGHGNDIIGGNDGTINGATTAQGPIDESLSFNGTTDDVTPTSYWSVVESNTDYTFMFWAYPTGSTGVNRNAVTESESDDGGTPDDFILLGINSSDKWRAAWRDDSDTFIDITSTASFTANQWINYCATASGDTRTLYIDGTQVATDTTTLSTFNELDVSRIGTRIADLAEADSWAGRLSDLMIWEGVALSASEIKAQMSIGTHPVMYS